MIILSLSGVMLVLLSGGVWGSDIDKKICSVSCQTITGPDGSKISLLPKLLPKPSGHLPVNMANVNGFDNHIVCRLPDCYRKPCIKGRCDETVDGYRCVCQYGFTGKNCETAMKARIYVTSSGTPGKIFVADPQDGLNFTSIPLAGEPRDVAYDSVEKKIYWTDDQERKVYRADEDGRNREEVPFQPLYNNRKPYFIAISESLRILYIAYNRVITSVNIGQGSDSLRKEVAFTSDGYTISSLIVDDEQGYLYWARVFEIYRKPLDSSAGTIATILKSRDLKWMKLCIDFSRNPRRLFIFDVSTQIALFKDITDIGGQWRAKSLHGDTVSTWDLTVDDGSSRNINETDSVTKEMYLLGLTDIAILNDTLYWTKSANPPAIVVMPANMDQSNRSLSIRETNEIQNPNQLSIVYVEP
ncbi:low-density lipoprotein receptor-related protein 6-like [Lytechinus variegatus]|uniref:low-density lipoprotein receptor-related protein 6-like n=1 Tax=Lytechinus variegatus TaxID=7654 RepID=UPI001BB1A4BF|nr:low-density lipoprotein receptor-related protein 6-like [Lytechinus variegatus]